MPRLRLLLLLILAAGCAAGAPDAPVAAPPPAMELPLGLRWVERSAELRALLLQTYGLAGRRLEELTAGRAPGTWAVALDADETVISNVRYQRELAESGESFSQRTWHAWARRRQATALPGARAFLERARELGGRIAIVTNRDEEICGDTEANFRALDLPFDVMLCRAGESRKEPRWERIENGTADPGLPPLEIVMWLGDNIQDFPGWSQERRKEPDAAFDPFGRRYFVIPNPLYGSWTGNRED